MQPIVEFGLVLLSAALAVVLSAKLRLPQVAALLIAGMVIGPNVLHLVQLPTIEAFADIGAVLLLFMIGVEFSVAKLLAGGLRPVLASLLIIFLTFVLMHEAAMLLGFDSIASLYIAAIFSMSSTAIMMKILEQKGLVERQETPLLVTILIIEDVIAVFMLTFFSSFNAGAAGSVLGALALSMCILAFGYVALQAALRKLASAMPRHWSEDSLLFFSFTLGIGMSVLASFLGLTPAIGAFLAGSIIAGLPNGRQFEDAVRPFNRLFPPFFFLSIGMLISPAALLSSAGAALVLIGTFLLTVFAASAFSFFLISSGGRSSVFVGLAMLPLGEFSLLIAKEGAGAVNADLVGMASAGVLLTSIACSFALNRSDTIYLSLRRAMPPRFLAALRDASGYFRNVVSAFEPHGYFHKLFIHELKVVAFDLVYLTGAFLLFWLGRARLQFTVDAFGRAVPADVLLLAALVPLSLVPAARILLSAKKLFDALALIFSRTTPQANKLSLARNVAVSAAFFCLFANSALVVDALMLPPAFNWLSPVFLALSVFFMWSAIRAASFWFFLQERKPINLLRSRVLASGDDLIVVAPASKRRKKGGGKNVLFLR
jgi:Kef-type K+ transport system membrane component KefB